MTQIAEVVLGKQSGFITADGQFIPQEIPHLGECNTYETEMHLYCPCEGRLYRDGYCQIARDHGRDDVPCTVARAIKGLEDGTVSPEQLFGPKIAARLREGVSDAI